MGFFCCLIPRNANWPWTCIQRVGTLDWFIQPTSDNTTVLKITWEGGWRCSSTLRDEHCNCSKSCEDLGFVLHGSLHAIVWWTEVQGKISYNLIYIIGWYLCKWMKWKFLLNQPLSIVYSGQCWGCLIVQCWGFILGQFCINRFSIILAQPLAKCMSSNRW